MVLNHYNVAPRELNVTFADVHGDVELECVRSEYGDGSQCEGDIDAQGEGHVTVAYRAIDERLESVEEVLLLHGDEEEITLRGYFDEDASLERLSARIYRAAGSSVVVEVEAPPFAAGEVPSFVLRNGSDEEIVPTIQGHVLGSVMRVDEDGEWERIAHYGGSCGFGLGPFAMAPGVVAPAGDFGVRTPLRQGSYVFVVEYDDVETLGQSHISRRIATRFEVTEEVPVEDVDPAGLWGLFLREEPDLWARATPPPRPGLERPAGREGFPRAEGAPLLADGDDVAGVLTPERSRHSYRLDLQPGEEGVVRIFARCLESPCSAMVGIYSGVDDTIRGQGDEGMLHRDPPSWSLRNSTLGHDGGVLVIGCEEECDASWEFYGRVHVRQIPKDELY